MHLLEIAMPFAVSLVLIKIKSGSVPDVNLKEVSSLLANKGDNLLYRSNKDGETAHIFNETAKAIAFLSFAPGGVRVFNHHWETNIEDIPERARPKVIEILGSPLEINVIKKGIIEGFGAPKG